MFAQAAQSWQLCNQRLTRQPYKSPFFPRKPPSSFPPPPTQAPRDEKLTVTAVVRHRCRCLIHCRRTLSIHRVPASDYMLISMATATASRTSCCDTGFIAFHRVKQADILFQPFVHSSMHSPFGPHHLTLSRCALLLLLVKTCLSNSLLSNAPGLYIPAVGYAPVANATRQQAGTQSISLINDVRYALWTAVSGVAVGSVSRWHLTLIRESLRARW